jgi:hypothetical protein
MKNRPPIYGLMAEFSDAQELVAATHQAYQAGYRHLDAYSPFPIEALAEALGYIGPGFRGSSCSAACSVASGATRCSIGPR